MIVVDIFDKDNNLIERTSLKDLGFNPRTNSSLMSKYAQDSVYENAYYSYFEHLNIDRNEYRSYESYADEFALEEKRKARWELKRVADKVA